MNALAVIVPSRNAANLIVCVEAVWRADDGIPVVIVDDGLEPTDEQRQIFVRWDREHCPVWVRGAKPFVFARNVNLGIRKVPSMDVVLLNDDAVLVEGSLKGLQRAVMHPEFGVVSAAVFGPSNLPEHAPVDVRDGIRHVRAKTIPFIAVLVPRRVIDIVGVLDERFTDYGGDDDDYCFRVRQAGFKLGIYDRCVVDHGTLQSTFRPDGKGRSIQVAREQFRGIHGFEMATR